MHRDDHDAELLGGARDVSPHRGEVARVGRRRVGVEAEHADRVARGERHGGRERVVAGDVNAGRAKVGDGRVATGIAGVARVIVGDVAHDDDAAVDETAKRGGGAARLAKREAARRARTALSRRGTSADRALDVQQKNVGALNEWLERLSEAVRIRRGVRNRRRSVSAANFAHFGSRFVPSVTSPPAQMRNGADSGSRSARHTVGD